MHHHEADAEKARLIRLLDNTRLRTLTLLQGIDGDRVVHQDTGWRVKDVVRHIVFWEEEVLAALIALKENTTYIIGDFFSFDAYNHQDFQRRRDQPFLQIQDDLRTVRDRLKAALVALPPERFEGTMLFPWPQGGTLSDMMAIMAGHECEHVNEILSAVEARTG
ncbi:MAG TPA: DinB family protein [Aggregatilineaceae bacterium]|jgi:hypothetical protein|nr:DinB family protein [Aggregatilineaceae bacterium]